MNTGIKPELIPIIAAYWGCDIDFETKTKAGRSVLVKMDEHTICAFGERWRYAKLHLRPLWSITEGELRELAELIGMGQYVKTFSGWKYKGLRSKADGGDFLCIDGDSCYTISIHMGKASEIINHLRSKGFCLDQCLIDAGLVQWKEVENG